MPPRGVSITRCRQNVVFRTDSGLGVSGLSPIESVHGTGGSHVFQVRSFNRMQILSRRSRSDSHRMKEFSIRCACMKHLWITRVVPFTDNINECFSVQELFS